jgi:DNA repair protein RecN (Recombination protein N)
LIDIANELEKTENTTQSLENSILKLSEDLNEIATERDQLAKLLSEKRQTVLQDFAQRIKEDLNSLEMPYVQIDLQLNRTELSSTGLDSLVFLFSANLGSPVLELSKAASGGEISRINFCIRNLIAEKKSLPTLIYDEADTGVSGQVATRIGELLRKQGKNQQVIAITHLPQVAAAGENQLFVFKSHIDNFSETKARYLSMEEREKEIATILSGNNPSESALSAAKDLIKSYSVDYQ